MQNRIERVLTNLPENFEAGLVNSFENRFYLLGFPSSAGTLLLFADKAYFIVDFRYIEAARARVEGIEVMLQDRLYDQVLELLKKHGVGTLAVEQSCTVGELNALSAGLPGITLDKGPALTAALEKTRALKEPGEIALAKEAQRITDAAFDYICTRIAPGRKERDLALEMEIFMKQQGAEALAFDTILVSGKNSSLPHGVPGEKIIEKGDFVTMDYGARYHGYNTDMTRTVAVGHATEEMRQVYDTVLQAQLAALEAVKAGANCRGVDKIARDIIYAAGYEGCFGHGLGHAVGIEIHENPRFSPGAAPEDTLEPGMMMTVEPGIYLPGKFGVRIEDSVIVTADGYDDLAKSPKNLIIL